MRRTGHRPKLNRLAALAIAGALGVVAVPAGSAVAETASHHSASDGSTGGTIRRGSTGFRVLQVQYVLSSLGYTIEADGRFGPATEAAVRKFQASRGLQVDGIVGPKTSAALGLTNSSSAPTPSTPAPSTPAPSAPATTTPAPSTPTPAPATDPAVIYQHPRPKVERWHGAALAAGWTEAEWQTLSCIIFRESGGIPTAKNRSSGAAGLLQIMWSVHYTWIGGSAEQLLDGETNLRLGRELFLRNGWKPWKSTTRAC